MLSSSEKGVHLNTNKMLKHYLSFSTFAFISFLHLTVLLKMLLQYQNLTVSISSLLL